MPDDVLLNKGASIERCIRRAREAALDMGHHVVRCGGLGLPQGPRDVFDLPQRAGRIDAATAESLKAMAGFRKIAVHEHQKPLLPITVKVITTPLDDCLRLSAALLHAGPTA